MLTAYIAATNRLLQNPVPANPLYSSTDLTVYINEGRQQLAGDTECIRASGSAALSANVQLYPFSLFNTFPAGTASGTIVFSANPSNNDTITLNGIVWTFVSGAPGPSQTQIGGTCSFTIATLVNQLNVSGLSQLSVANYAITGGSATTATLQITYKTVGAAGNTYTLAASAGTATPSGPVLTGGILLGIQSPLTIRQLSINTSGSIYKLMTSRSWPWFERFQLANGTAIAASTPFEWAQQGRGATGTFGVGPPPSSGFAIQADVVCLPAPLATDADPEAIPYPFTDAVPYYAAYKAYLSSQKTQDATIMFQRYEQFAARAIQITTPTVIPSNYPGGIGAQLAAAKSTLTKQPQAQGAR